LSGTRRKLTHQAVRALVDTYVPDQNIAQQLARDYIRHRDNRRSKSSAVDRARQAHATLWKDMFYFKCPKCVYHELGLGGKSSCLTFGGLRKTFLSLPAAARRDHCGQQHGGTVGQKKQNEARHLRRMLNLFSNPARKDELFAMRACCNSCNQALEALGLTREVLAYYRDVIALERELAAAQAAAADAANQAQWAGLDSWLLF